MVFGDQGSKGLASSSFLPSVTCLGFVAVWKAAGRLQDVRQKGFQYGSHILKVDHMVDNNIAIGVADITSLRNNMACAIAKVIMGCLCHKLFKPGSSPELPGRKGLTSIEIFRNDPIIGVSDNGKGQITVPLLLRNMAVLNVLLSIKVGEPFGANGRIVVRPKREARALVPGQSQIVQKHLLDTLATRLGDVDKNDFVLMRNQIG